MENSQEIKVSDWIVTLIVTSIPVVGFIMLFVWAFGSNTPPSKANWAKAILLFMAVVFAIYLVMALMFGSALMMGMGQDY